MSGPESGAPPARVVAIVVSFNTGPILETCLARLAADPDIAAIVVVDNGNPPEAEARLRAFAAANARARLIAGQGNVGFARGCNLGAAAAPDADVFLFVNPDLALAPGAAVRLAETAARGPQPCVAGGRLFGPDGAEQRGARREAITPWRVFAAFSGLTRLEPLHPIFRSPFRERDPVPAAPIEVAAVSGALMAMTVRDFRALGGFDEAYFLHVEDIDICARARRAGGSVWFDPRAEGRHEGATSNVARAEVERHKARGYVRFFRTSARGPWSRLQAEAMALILPWLLPMRWSVRRRGRD
ncbi:MAG: glycosyltransferase [Alphaproteobacteria bacterium]|nr:glycosyltransferase [Alphaproteobacteria bacterium]